MVHPGNVRPVIWRLVTVVLILFFCGKVAEGKVIRLRNETIDTTTPENRAVRAAVAKNILQQSGLFLIQFDAPPTPAERQQLRAEGIELIKYVPDDAYIAKLKNISPATVTANPHVTWIGKYRPEHKVHPRLTEIAKTQTNQPMSVTVILCASATTQEVINARATFSAIRSVSYLRQGIFIRGDLSSTNVTVLSQSSAVLWMEHASKHKLMDEAASKLVGGDDGRIATPTLTEQWGFNGSNVVVSVADTGLDTGNTNTMHPDLRGRVTGLMYYGTDVTDASDGYGHGTHCAGIVAGNAATGETDPDTGQFYGLGVASGASLFIQRIFDSDANELDFTSDETLTHDAVRNGAKIGSNSWGNDVQGDYDSDCAQFDELVRDADANTPGDQPYIEEFSAGNAGPQAGTIGSPAAAKNVIATGASENTPGTLALTYGLYGDGADTMCDFSSRGPCADGRIKPDLVAPGSWIASAASAAAPNEAAIAWSPIDDYYVYMGGTSMAGPHAAGAAAVFVQFYKTTHTNAMPSPALVKAALINSADELDELNGGPGPAPNNDEGWGRINLKNIVVTNINAAPRFYQYLDQTILLTNSQVYSQHIFVQRNDQPLKITLAYTDVPGFPGAIPALVNDLDLEVVAPDGTLYRGNQFGTEDSAPNAPTPDNLNNVEGVYLSQPMPGDYLIRVRASKVVQDARNDTPAIDQDFALVSSGNFVRPGTGFILLDRPAYTAPGTINIEVIDPSRAANNSVSVLITNLTGHHAVTSLAQGVGNYGAFTSSVTTVTGATGSGQIQVANGDILEADYVDSGGVQRSTTASVNLIPPTISSVAANVDIGVMTITWQTSEPATSIVHYGTNSSNLNLGVTNLALVTSHLVRLSGLSSGTTYYYAVISSDAAANTATDNNSGANYSFIGVPTPTVLLVDAYDTVAEENSGSTVIPDSAYTNALAMAGVNYGFWKVSSRGSPQLSDLQAFPVVMWRLTDDEVNYGVDADGLPDPTATNNTLNAQQQFMIESYLNGGGSFFMASMGILSQISDGQFRRSVLHVGGFEQNPDPPAACSDCDEDFGVPAILGAPSSPASGLNVALDYSNYPYFDDGFGDFYGPDFSSTFTPASTAAPLVFESVSGKPCGMCYPKTGGDSPGRVIFLSFPFDAIPTNGDGSNNAVSFLKNAISFLAPGADGRGTVVLDNTVYTTNDVVTVEVGDSNLRAASQTQVTFTASSQTNQATITLLPTTHPGLFKGHVTLINGSAGTNQLQVQNGDTITATYYDSGEGSNVTATAVVDTVPPEISNVAATTDYSNAKVTWKTSKPADSSVQYSESPLPDRTSYVSTLVTNHAVTVTGLAANRIYYYQVVSTDQAGNVTVDDNNGNLYTFRTLKAPSPPWFDNLENGATGWSVVPDPGGTDINWQLGTPNNRLVSSAHSGANTWGSDLNGSQNFFIGSTYLYSPVIDLTGFKSATLNFWHVCNFATDPNLGVPPEDGVVYVSTNDATPPGNLPTAMDYEETTTSGWEQADPVDLTPFVGKTIRVVFYYEGVVFNRVYGWTIDDVSITGVAAGGNVVITKNLGQGMWSLSSVSSIGLVPIQSDITPAVTLNRLAAGQYVVQFGSVPFYQKPDNQTNTLAEGGTIHFNGDYTFVDANHNGISDAWEQTYLGTVTTNSTQSTDTDHDGMSDYAEFIAGTDPMNAASRFCFTGTGTPHNGVVEITWTAVTNRLYQVNVSTNLSSWQPVTDWLQASNSSTMSYVATNSVKSSYYRVQVKP